jgi:hypothetical protein
MKTVHALGLIATGIVVFGVVLPTIKEEHFRSFCDAVRVAEDAEAVWKRGEVFDHVRGEATHIALEDGASDGMDFSLASPSLFVSVYHCYVSVDKTGAVLSKTWGHED